jgi:glycosyltransferase involved in cell wall biosynthesis
MQKAPERARGAQPIAVLHVIDTLNVGGAEIHCLRLASALDRQKYNIHVAYGASGALESLLRRLNLWSFRYGRRAPRLGSFDTLLSILRLYRYIKRNNIRVVHTYLYTGHVIASLAALAARVPVIEHVHDWRYENLRVARREWHVHTRHYRFVWLFHSLAARTVVLTPDNYAVISKGRRRPEDSCVLLTNGVPDPTPTSRPRSQICEELGVPPETALFLVAGRLTATKDVALALRSFARACAMTRGMRLLIMGDGPARAELMQLADALSLANRVRFLGAVENLYDWLPHCAAVLHPAHVELNSLTILEAMRCGVPVIARQSVSGNRMLIQDGQTGRLIGSDEETSWAQAIVELARNTELRTQMGEAARRQAQEQFDLRVHARRIEAIYQSLKPAQQPAAAGKAC